MQPRYKFATLLAVALLAVPAWQGSAAAGDGRAKAEPGARLFVSGTGEGESTFALALKAERSALPAAVPHDHIVLIDTSASQIGEHRKQSIGVLKEFLAALPATDRASVFAVDVTATSLTAGRTSAGWVRRFR